MAKKRKKILRQLRRVVQAIAILLFVYLLVGAETSSTLTTAGGGAVAEEFPLRSWLPVDLFPRLSPLLGLTAMLAAHKYLSLFLPAIILLVLTILFGRFFCAWICPLGTTIDVTDRALRSKRHRTGWKLYDGRRFKYYLLLFLIVLSAFGVQIAGWFDPMSLVTRSYGLVIHPYLTFLCNAFFDVLHGITGGLDSLHLALRNTIISFEQSSFNNHLILLTLFVLILALGMVYRRYWCRNICPLGALLSLVGQWGMLQRVVGHDCIDCGRCKDSCGMNAISSSEWRSKLGECTLCMTCRDICPVNAITFRASRSKDQCVEMNLSRRVFAANCVGAALAVPLLRLNFSRRLLGGNLEIIRPPGALPEEKFLARCVTCGECMKVCVTNGLQPTLLDAGLEGIWTPKLVPRVGYCHYNCNLCGRACPSGAIEELPVPEKQEIVIGRAYIDQRRCIPWRAYNRYVEGKTEWSDTYNCAVCEEVCPTPTKSIRFNPLRIKVDGEIKEIRRPYIDEDVCNGCGFCENVCPVKGRAAVIVDGMRGRVKKLPAVSTPIERYFPDVANGWTKKGTTYVFVGKKLYDYINGGAPPYYTYGFKQAAYQEYSKRVRKGTLQLDIWEFDGHENAFGVFAQESYGDTIDLGNQARAYENFVYAWCGKFFIRVETRGGVSRDDAIDVAREAAARIGVKSLQLPSLVTALPSGFEDGSVRYFHEKLILDSEMYLNENILNLNPSTNVALAKYLPSDGWKPTILVLVRYPTAMACRAAYGSLQNFYRKKGKALKSIDARIEFWSIDGSISCAVSKDRTLAACFRVTAQTLPVELLNSIGLMPTE